MTGITIISNNMLGNASGGCLFFMYDFNVGLEPETRKGIP